MAIAFRAGGATSGGTTLTLSASLQAGDLLLFITGQTNTSGAGNPGATLASSGPTQPSKVGSDMLWTAYSNYDTCVQLWQMTAVSGDASATVTLTQTGVAAFLRWGWAAWSGTAGIDVSASGHTAQGAETTSFQAPSATTTVTGDWAVYLAYDFPAGSFTGEPGTLREGGNIEVAITDSNASVGSSGTVIGGSGNNWTFSSSVPFGAYTVGLAPGGGQSVALPADAVTLAAPLLTPMVGPDPFPAPGVALAAPAVSLAFGAASIPLPVAQVTLAAPLVAPHGPPAGGQLADYDRAGAIRKPFLW